MRDPACVLTRKPILRGRVHRLLLEEGTPGDVDEEPFAELVVSVEVPSRFQRGLESCSALRTRLASLDEGLPVSLDLSLLVFRDGPLQDHDGNRPSIGERED